MASRRELLRDSIVQEFSKISLDNGYNTDVTLVSRYPMGNEIQNNRYALAVEIGEEELVFEDTPRSVVTSKIKFIVWGYFQGDTTAEDQQVYGAENAGELLLHDVKRVLHSLMIKNVNDATSRWIITVLAPIRCRGPKYDQMNRGFFTVEFTSRLLFQDGTFS